MSIFINNDPLFWSVAYVVGVIVAVALARLTGADK